MILRIPIGGFPLSQETTDALEASKTDRLLFRCSFDIQNGGIDAASTYLSDKRTPNLLIVETSAAGEQVFQQLESLAGVCDPETRLILIGRENDIELFRTLIQFGVSDYLVAPVTAEALRDSIIKVYAGVETSFDGRVIAFAGMAGGVGSSVVAHNTANELMTAYDEKVIVVDLDICYGTAGLNFNIQPRQTVVDALAQMGGLEGAILDQYFMPFGEKLALLASPASLNTGVQVSAESFDALITAVKPAGEFIILDLPHIWAPWMDDALALADDLVLVSKPDLTGLRNAKNVVEYLGPKRGTDAPTRLVLNQVGAAKRSDLSNKDFKDALALEPSIAIPYDPEAFGKALNNGEMMSKAAAKSKATVAMAELAALISGRNDEAGEGKKKGFSLFGKGKK